jgi:hypothetical protein
MKLETKYNYEKIWSVTSEEDALKIIAQEVGDADVKGTLTYIKEVLSQGRELRVGSCTFRRKNEKG